ncbi:hypothetical protein CAPN001_13340 [Capnocytophaga stomatis]|uniref:NTF2 fold immunity protein n=1 Tax=Capnocytophaga stomatis TaxID=1848904 RepID=UPI00194F5DAF|nr:NTF2 fold immunity protein [Capnocytophaga stomatis]GIJ96765.1 hypothetical protein CAPN001_13340 [Capnocytophaga stomatis]
MSNLHPEAIAIGKSKEKGISLKYKPITDDDVQEICKCKSLVNVGLEGTNITDKALEYLATLPKLGLLWLGETKITGEGFIHFENHPKLDCIGIEKTKVNDNNLKIIAKIPKLTTLRIDGTKITFNGLLAVADNQKLKPVSHTKFSAEQMEIFKQTQRNFAKKKTSVTLSKTEIESAKNHLLAFFKAMAEWEQFANLNFDKGHEDEITAKIKELYQKYATKKHHNNDRYHWTATKGGSYGEHQIVDIEIISKNRIYIHTNANIFQDRFLMIKQKDNSWQIDGCQRKRGNWEKQSL